MTAALAEALLEKSSLLKAGEAMVEKDAPAETARLVSVLADAESKQAMFKKAASAEAALDIAMSQ